MENTRRQGIKDEYNEKTRKDSFTATERGCHSWTSKLLWMEFFAGEVLGMDILDGGIMRRG
jgi:hypothetical protein